MRVLLKADRLVWCSSVREIHEMKWNKIWQKEKKLSIFNINYNVIHLLRLRKYTKYTVIYNKYAKYTLMDRKQRESSLIMLKTNWPPCWQLSQVKIDIFSNLLSRFVHISQIRSYPFIYLFSSYIWWIWLFVWKPRKESNLVYYAWK